MARTMLEQSTKVYRTVVKAEFLEDSVEKTWKYGDNYERITVRVHQKGDVITEVFGPYPNKAQNQNYSMLQGYRIVETGEKLYKRSDYPYMTDQQWNGSYYETATKRDYVQTVKFKVEHQELAPVFALQSSGALVMELDWVKYRERG